MAACDRLLEAVQGPVQDGPQLEGRSRMARGCRFLQVDGVADMVEGTRLPACGLSKNSCLRG